MPSFKVWDIVKVPFPYTDGPTTKHRPALVVAADKIQSAHGLIWLLMITSAENRRWPDDVPISQRRETGLPAPSVVRCAKIATIDARDAEVIGTLPRQERIRVARNIARQLAPVLQHASKSS